MKSSRWVLLFLFVLVACRPAALPTGALPSDVSVDAPTGPLRDLADRCGFKIGAAVSLAPLRDEPLYGEVLAREFNFVTTENALKFEPVHPRPDQYAFQEADAIVEFAQAHDMRVRGHTLIWHNQLPLWLQDGQWTRDELLRVMREHVATVVGRYRGRICVWDVVNEAVADGGRTLRPTVWQEVIGADYLDLAFRWAHEADPDALLFYNDYNAEGMDRKSDMVYELLKGMLARGVPVHGVGLQMHITLNMPPRWSAVQENIARLNALGLEVHITELDVRIHGKPTGARLLEQAQIYRDLLSVCLDAEKCTAVTMWGFTDRHSWVPDFFVGSGAALPFDEAYRPKPAYGALVEGLAQAEVR